MQDGPDPLTQLAAPPIFVVGHHRSGTTWVYDLLTYPDEVAGVFESWLFTQNLGLGSLLHWGHWSEEQAGRRVDLMGVRPGLAQLVSREEVFETCRQLARRWLGNAIAPGHRYLVEKSPDHLYATDVISEIFPGARFVNIIRDGRDVAVSGLVARSWSPEWIRARITDPYRLGKGWTRALSASALAKEALGPRYHEVRYEALQDRPVEVVRELFAFCGLPTDDDLVHATVKANDFANKTRGPDDTFRRSGRVGDWESSLRLVDRLLFQAGSGTSLVEQGYARSRWWWLRRKA